MVFRIIGDEIEYEFFPFARILPNIGAMRRANAEGAIEDCDPEAVERDRDQDRKDLEAEHKDEIEALDARVSDLEAENTALQEELDRIEGAGGIAQRIEDLQNEIAAWRSRCKTYEDLYAASQQKTRRPRKRV